MIDTSNITDDAQFWRLFKPELRVINAKMPRPPGMARFCRGSFQYSVTYAIAKGPNSKDIARIHMYRYDDGIVRFVVHTGATHDSTEVSVTIDEALAVASWIFDATNRRIAGEQPVKPPVPLDMEWTDSARYVWSIAGHELMESDMSFSPWRESAYVARRKEGKTHEEAIRDMRSLRFDSEQA